MNKATQTQLDSSTQADLVRHACSRRIYCIRVEGRLDDAWTDWFGGLAISHDGDESVLCGSVADQSALHGVLRKLHDLGLALVEVKKIDDADDGMMW
ncbi:MAG: hypothetical protein R2856_29880 [Caldilineaceae bacterium]|nr:hypothetical protein [Caldilineaceae bacterium]